jgi:heme/copper-type cytochrome/quinol oxidase subunit 2
MAGQVDMLYIYLLLVAGVMTTLIFLAVTVLAIKYRRKPGREAIRSKAPPSSNSAGRSFRSL